METPWKVIVAFVGVFAAGAIFGGVFTLRASSKRFGSELAPNPRPTDPAHFAKDKMHPPAGGLVRPAMNPITPQLMRQFMRRFPNLTPDQNDTVTKVIGRAGEDLYRLRQENFADTSRVTERMYADISAVLSQEQREELEKMRRQLQEKLQSERQRKESVTPPDPGMREKMKEKGAVRPTGN